MRERGLFAIHRVCGQADDKAAAVLLDSYDPEAAMMAKANPKKIRIPSFRLPFLRSQTLAVGLDIGSHAVKLCELTEAAGGGFRLNALGSARLPAGALDDGALQDPDAVGKVISGLFSNLKIKHKKVAISISGYSVIVKKINLPVMNEADLEKHIHTEAEQYIPFDINDVYLDFQDMKTGGAEGERTDIMLVAAKKEIVDAYLAMLRRIGLKPVVVDVDAFALEGAYETIAGPEENTVLVDIGASKMNINIVSHGASVLARDVPLGGRQLTEQIESRFDLDFEEAEALKIGEIPAGDRKGAMEVFFAEVCNQWLAEVRRAIDFFSSGHPDESIGRIVLSGGGAKIRGLVELFQRELEVPVEVFNPFLRAEVDSGQIDPAYLKSLAPEMTLAAGLAARPVEV